MHPSVAEVEAVAPLLETVMQWPLGHASESSRLQGVTLRMKWQQGHASDILQMLCVQRIQKSSANWGLALRALFALCALFVYYVHFSRGPIHV